MAVTVPVSESTAAARDGAAAAIASARRAALADRYAGNAFTVEWREVSQLAPIAAAWRDLAASALEDNVFYDPAFALAAAPVFGRDVGALLVWSGTRPRRLVGLLPARIETRRYGIKLPVLVGWTHPYAPFGVPLVEREAAEPVIAAILAHIGFDPALPGLLLLPFLRQDGAFAAILDAILRRAQMPAVDLDARRRALFAPGAERAQYVARAVGARRRKEWRRLTRRLGEAGAMRLVTTATTSAVTAAMEDFLALEATGWKGRAGTAAVNDVDLRRFLRAAVAGLAAQGKAGATRLLLDDRAVAAALVLRSGATAWFWKIAYDESFARFSPGVLLTLALTEDLVEDATIAQADSCATQDHPMIDHIWRERAVLCDRLIAVRPSASLARARRLEQLRTAAIGGVKRIRNYLKRG